MNYKALGKALTLAVIDESSRIFADLTSLCTTGGVACRTKMTIIKLHPHYVTSHKPEKIHVHLYPTNNLKSEKKIEEERHTLLHEDIQALLKCLEQFAPAAPSLGVHVFDLQWSSNVSAPRKNIKQLNEKWKLNHGILGRLHTKATQFRTTI